jgi:tetratricopeptide (TPR) repeat protein
MISLRFARFRKYYGALSVAFLAALSSSLFAASGPAPQAAAPPKAPAKAAAKPRGSAISKRAPAPAATAPEAASAPGAHMEFADAWPTDQPAGADLQLRPEEARKAEAIVAFTAAILAEDNADTEKSLAGYRKVLELDPSYAELAVKVAYELARRNDISGGIQVLKDCIKAAPKEPLPLIYLSQLYSKYLKKADLALKYAEQALMLAPDNFASLLANFELHVAAGDQKKAEAILERARKVNSVDPKYWVQVGDLFTRLYLKEDGSSLPEEQQRMNAVYRKAAELANDDAAILSKVGDYFVLSRQVKEAIPYYLKVLDAPQSEKDSLVNNTREKLAHAFMVTEQVDEAITTLEKMAKDNPLRFVTFEMLGELYQRKGESEKALHNFQHSLLLDASQPQNYLRLANLLLDTKQFDKAVETMKQARGRFPDLPQITFVLAVSLSQAHRHTEAMTAFAEAVADAENSQEELLNAGFYFQYAAAAEQAGLTDKAAELLKQSITMDPNKAEAYNYLGYMWADRGERLDEAGEMIKKALEMDPDNGAYLDSLGWLYFKKGEHERALKELLKAVEAIKPEDAVVFDHLADTYQALGKTAEALNYWQKALTLSAEDKKQAGKISEKIEAAKQKVTSSTVPLPKPEPVPETPAN